MMLCSQAQPSTVNISHSLPNVSVAMSLDSGYGTSTEIMSVDGNGTMREMMTTESMSKMPPTTTSATLMSANSAEGETS